MTSGQLTSILMTVLIIMIVLLFALTGIYLYIRFRNKKQEANKPKDSNEKKEIADSTLITKSYTKQSIFDFMDFDKIEDNMIVQKNGNKYLMVINCQGINYDLMSEVEKTSVEAGFLQFLNTLRHPIQIYVQTRTVNLENSITKYKTRVKEFEDKLRKMRLEYENMLKSNNYTEEQLNKYFYEITKQTNLCEYGKDVIYNTEKLSLNKNVLTKKYYIIISYYATEASNGDFDKEEIKNLAFSELYTKAQSMIRTLSICGVNGKILDSTELADLLYVSYNRDESEVYSVQKAMQSGYEDLYSTAPDVLNKRMRALDKEIEDKALLLAQEKVLEAQTEQEQKIREKETHMDDLIDRMAQIILKENEQYIGQDIAEKAKEKLEQDKETKTKQRKTKEVKEKNAKKETKTRTRKTKETA